MMEQIKLQGQIKVSEMSSLLTVSEETVRRDLVLLEKEGLAKRVYGGAVLPKLTSFEPPYLQRQMVNKAEKARIGHAAAELIESGDTIVIDIGTTALEVAKAIADRERLTILTNSLAVAYHLMESVNSHRFSGKIVVIGGELNSEQQSMSGTIAESIMSQFRVDKAFISVGGVSLERGISDYDINESGVSRRMIEAAYRTIVLADHSKLDKEAFVEIAPLERTHVIVSDVGAPKEWLQFLRSHHIQWIDANAEGRVL